MTVPSTDDKTSLPLSLLLRLLLATGLWWLLTEGRNDSWILGIPALLLAVAFSYRLRPARAQHLSITGLLAFCWYFSRQSLLAGLDVARRTLSPDLPIQPGEVEVRIHLPAGPPYWLLTMTLSLLPGTIIIRCHQDWLLLHCIDTTQPIEQDVFTAQRRVAALFGLPIDHLLQQEQATQQHGRQQT